MHACASAGKSQGVFLSCFAPGFLRQDLSQNLELTNSVRIAGQPVPVEGGVALLPQSWLAEAGAIAPCFFYMGSGVLNPGPH